MLAAPVSMDAQTFKHYTTDIAVSSGGNGVKNIALQGNFGNVPIKFNAFVTTISSYSGVPVFSTNFLPEIRTIGMDALKNGNQIKSESLNDVVNQTDTAFGIADSDLTIGFFGSGYSFFYTVIRNATQIGWIRLRKENGGRKVKVDAYAYTTAPSITVGATILPVELMDFKATVQKNQVALNWKTASETNNAGFELQRSMDGKTFQNLNFIEGNGTTQEQQDYVYDDKDLRQGQTYYYRLKQIDFDGQFEYSKVITARTAGQEVTGIFAPNPAVAGQTVLSYSTPGAGEMVLRVFDVAGQELLRQTNEVEEGSNRFELDFRDLGTGLFFVKMEQGGRTAYEKVVIE